MNLRITAALATITLAMVSPAVTSAATDAAPAVAPKSPWIAADFKVPVLVETPTFKVVPLSPALAKVDFDAYMSSIDHLQKTFTRSTAWPHAGITDADAVLDMETEQARFTKRESFAYAVLTPDGLRERGCIYVYPSPLKGYDAMVRIWVTKAEHDAGFDAELYAWATNWLKTDWPFAKVAYPGRAIAWGEWDGLVAGK
ncbi:twin-arginine translocation pathway signal protein [Novosphingobium sp. CECT 9465]|uniref:twin-arginine translocation pathway signal protein n=1 Tax=Novosphingobium sp. CECT 9465 TaxID=2829794 RepID=UPI001E30C095|nr:twin-arginine translocation pathway signal protein [Novosphingobium sp. CECT 9465]CAH0497641.1 hypothetical protein NVSP9465_02710 [Novosphingobium sp. CECT 9465]